MVAMNGNGHGHLRNSPGIVKYTKYWTDDAAKDTETHNKTRLSEYADLVNGYYDGATQLYEYGWGQHFHFARYYKGEAFFQAIARHEHYLASQIGLKRGMRVLDVGCGVGGPAREIARFADCQIVGLNNNAYQVEKAKLYTAKAGLSDQVTYVAGDFMKLSKLFGENSFDAVFSIEATCHAPSWEGVYGEMFKVLKPGGMVGIYEWCLTEKYDKTNPEHRKISHGIEVGDGIAEMRSIAQARQALKTVGFEILHEEDLAERPDSVPWYYPLRGNMFEAQTIWDIVTVARLTWAGKTLTQTTVRILEWLGLAPKGTAGVGEALLTAAIALVAGGEAKLFTPMMLFVARKPDKVQS